MSDEVKVKIANVFDPSSKVPKINEELGSVDEDLAKKLSDYMDSGVLLLRTTMLQEDVLAVDDSPRVPSCIRTDGEFVWSDASSYYVRHHRVSPGQDFIAHVESLDFTLPEVSEERVTQVGVRFCPEREY